MTNIDVLGPALLRARATPIPMKPKLVALPPVPIAISEPTDEIKELRATVAKLEARIVSLEKIFEPEPEGPLPRAIPMMAIITAVSVKYGITRHDIIGPYRQKIISRSRMIAMYLCRHLTLRSYPEIGRLFGDRDHTTIISAIAKITRERIEDEQLDFDLSELARGLKAKYRIDAIAGRIRGEG